MNSEKTFTERLRIAASLVGGQIQLADKANVPRRTFADYIAGQTEPGRDRLVSIADAAAVNIDWLAAGRGPMRLADRTAAELTGLVRPLRQPLGEGGGQQLVAIEHATAQELGERGYVLIPRYEAKAAAGVGTVVHSEQIVDYLAFKETWIREHLGLNPRLLLVLEALGDSMRPTIEDGDILLIDISEQHVRDNSIYVLVFGDELVVKRVERLRDGSVKIKSDNPAYGVETVPPGEVEKLWVVGRVRWSGGRV